MLVREGTASLSPLLYVTHVGRDRDFSRRRDGYIDRDPYDMIPKNRILVPRQVSSYGSNWFPVGLLLYGTCNGSRSVNSYLYYESVPTD